MRRGIIAPNLREALVPHQMKLALAGMAVALIAGPACAATVVLAKTLDASLDAGAYTGRFDVAGLLQDGVGRTFTITSARLAVTAFSPPTYGPASTFELPKAPFVIPILLPTEPKPTLVYDDVTIRTVLYLDDLADRLHVSAYGQSIIGQAGDVLHETGQTHTQTSPDIVTDTPSWIEIHRTSVLENWTRQARYGDIDAGFDVDPLGLSIMNAAGFFDFTAFAFPGTIRLTSAELSLDLTQTGGPPPGASVPEPAAWATLILGFSAAGAMLRRRPLSPAPSPARRRPRSSR